MIEKPSIYMRTTIAFDKRSMLIDSYPNKARSSLSIKKFTTGYLKIPQSIRIPGTEKHARHN